MKGTEIVEAQVVETSEGALVNYVPEIRRTPEQVKVAIESVEKLVREHMREGIDFGKIPGTPKPTLYKAGAERLARFFGLGAVIEQVRCTEDWEDGFGLYVYRVGIGPITPDGVVPIAWCEGCANSKEKKYARVPLPDAVNTLMKMAQKRAYVGAVLLATNTSDFFTQDLEDMPAEAIQGRASAPVAVDPATADGPGAMKITFGKHSGDTLAEIAESDPQYLHWLSAQFHAKADRDELPEDKKPLAYAVDEVLGGLGADGRK